jgi:LysR family glycine cleavage system transcriptional activator
MDASLPALVEFLLEEGRSPGAWQHSGSGAGPLSGLSV